MAFYNGGPYPAAFDGALFFADYSRDCLWVMKRGDDGLPDPTKRVQLPDACSEPGRPRDRPERRPVLRGLHTAARSAGSSTRPTNQPPVARRASSPTSGPAPLTVTFNGSASSDPDGRRADVRWDLDGDGAFDDASAAVRPVHVPGPRPVPGVAPRRRCPRGHAHQRAADHRRRPHAARPHHHHALVRPDLDRGQDIEFRGRRPMPRMATFPPPDCPGPL